MTGAVAALYAADHIVSLTHIVISIVIDRIQ